MKHSTSEHSPTARSRFSAAKARILAGVFAAIAFLMVPAAALAQRGPERDLYDARLEGYEKVVTIDGSVGMTWVLLVFLTAICLGVLFKDARRSHLD